MENRNAGFCRRPPARLLAVLLAATAGSGQALAENWTDRISLTGFMSAKYQKLDQDLYFNGDSTADSGIGQDGSFRGTMLGINLTADVSERIRVASQFLSTKEDDAYATHLDWGFVAVGVSDDVALRAGKIKFPTGIVNEYISVGNAYPWITPPMLFYTEEAAGANITREAYTGGSVLWEHAMGDVNMSVDLYGGEIMLEAMHVRGLGGTKFTLDWNEEITLQASYYRGSMRDTSNPAMEGKPHSNVALGMRLDMNDVVGYAEWASTDMELVMMKSSAWYATLGYQFGDWLPHLTYQYLEKGLDSMMPQEQNMITAGLRYDLSDAADVKIEYSIIDTPQGRGLFETAPGDTVNMIGLAVDVVF